MLDQHLYDRWHGEEVADLMFLDQLPEDFRIQFFPLHHYQRSPTDDIQKHVHASAMGKRCYSNRHIIFIGTGNEICEVIGHDKIHLSMGQYPCLRPACCS